MLFTIDTTWNRTLNWPATFNPTPNLEPGQMPTVVTLAAGAYHTIDVKSGRGIKLSAGEYFFDSLTIETGARLLIDGSGGPVFAYILDAGLIYRGNQNGSVNTPGMPVASFTVMTTGSATIETPFTGVVIAPNGSIHYSGASASPTIGAHRGAAFGNSIILFEDNVLQHYRDPYSFRGFAPNDGTPFIGDRVAVTGGSMIGPMDEDPTDEEHQSESVTAISRNGSSFVVMVGYNDHTWATDSPADTFYSGSSTIDPRDGTNRLLFRTTSEMGWSYSLDGGRTFNYGDRVFPPTGTAIIWGDPAVAKSDIDDPNVYYAQISGSDASWNANQDANGHLENNNGNRDSLVNTLDGYCISRSTDRGQTFPAVACAANGFQDGTALAVVKDANNQRQVYVTGTGTHVYWMDGETMTFHPKSTIPDPFADGTHEQHPRLRALGNLVYIVVKGRNNRNIIANRLDTTTNTWLGESIVATDAGGGGSFGVSTFSVSNGPIIAFDFGTGLDGKPKFRLMYEAFKPGNVSLSGMKVVECSLKLDPATCQTLPASTLGDPGAEANPTLRFSGGQWVAGWRKLDVSPGRIRFMVAHLTNTGFDERTVAPGIVPCTYSGVDGLWGEYDYLDGFGDGRFFAPYGVNGPGCRWQGTWTSDAHVGGSVFGF